MSETPTTLTPKSHLPPPPRPSCSSTVCDEDASWRELSPCAALRLSGFTGRRHNGRRVKRCTPAWLCVSFVVLSKHQCCHVEGAACSVFNIFHYKQMKSGTGWLMDSASPLWCWVSALHFPWTLPFPPALYLLQKTKFFSSCAKKTAYYDCVTKFLYRLWWFQLCFNMFTGHAGYFQGNTGNFNS